MILPFTFVKTPREAEIERRARRLEAQAGFLPWSDWTDFIDEAQDELLDGLRSRARRLNLRDHKIEKDRSAPAGEVRFICSFISDIDMVHFKIAVL
ncbi:hypothetical protein MHY87_03525 [Microvirga sp. ACRRW]|uniref:hypothetical protein n=1 Tax=Microvirga sp. ACRRW TaxID=2918205 RepID=UPI001EF6567F|nr:hypothetical protein [Microvirga sp. ACRRW]MCG7391971.1 hypothetical protein [Microvirga sp. ACRRW]